MSSSSFSKQKRGEARESALRAAQESIEQGHHKSFQKAAQDFNIPVSTLRRRILFNSRPPKEAHSNQQLLNLAQEKVLVDWLQYLGLTGHAASKRTVGPKVFDLCGKNPSKRWVSRFVQRHPDLVLGRPCGLDPKRAQAFNFTTCNHHFKLLGDFLEKHNIPWENVYNMDEKGIQLGGGRKGNLEKLFYSRGQKIRLQVQSANLELVTVIECVCADGTSTLLGFVFPGVDMFPEWGMVDNNIMYVKLSIYYSGLKIIFVSLAVFQCPRMDGHRIFYVWSGSKSCLYPMRRHMDNLTDPSYSFTMDMALMRLIACVSSH